MPTDCETRALAPVPGPSALDLPERPHGTCGCQLFGPLMRPAHTHGSAHRGDLVARSSPAAPRQLARRAQGAAPAQGAVRTVAVVVIDVLGQHGLQLSTSEDEHPVQHLTPNGADPSLGVGIRPWRPHRRGEHLESLGGKDRVERGGELGVRSRTSNRNRPTRSSRAMSRLRACWATHSPIGCAVTPSTWTRRPATWITNSTYSRCRNTVSTVKKSTASTPLACARRNCRQVRADRIGVGATPARWRMVQTVLAPIL
jgi:hypothetical protein